jgi:rare lipoprotein A
MTDAPEPRFAGVALGVAHPSLPAGTVVELTALDTGRTILAMVVARTSGEGVVALSPRAAQALGVGDPAAVRVRSVVAGPQDDRALRSGQAASPRLDAPPALLTALRRKLPASPAPAQGTPRPPAPRVTTAVPRPAARAPLERAAVPRPAPVRAAAPPPPARGGVMVQVAALSSASRAAALAQQLGGRVVPLGKLYRVQLGPFSDTAQAQRARDGAARRGYADARIIHSD